MTRGRAHLATSRGPFLANRRGPFLAKGRGAFLATGGAFRSSRQLVTSNGSKRNRGFSKKESLRRMLINLLVKNASPTQFLSRSIIIISIIIIIDYYCYAQLTMTLTKIVAVAITVADGCYCHCYCSCCCFCYCYCCCLGAQFFHKERKTGGVVRKRLEDRWLLHDETTTSIYENSAGF